MARNHGKNVLIGTESEWKPCAMVDYGSFGPFYGVNFHGASTSLGKFMSVDTEGNVLISKRETPRNIGNQFPYAICGETKYIIHLTGGDLTEVVPGALGSTYFEPVSLQ
jgi:hypothetical protein